MKFTITKRETQSNITPLLWGGVALWLASGIILSILAIFGYDYMEQDTLNEMLESLGIVSPVLPFIFVCIIAPIYEEFAFRYWTVGKLSARITSLILSTIVVYLEAGSILIGLGVAVLMFVLMFLVKKNEMALIISTSAIFSLMHISGFSSISVSVVLGLIQMFAGAVVICCLALRYRFVIAIAIHMINNIIALTPTDENDKILKNSRYNHNLTAITQEGESTMALKPINGKYGNKMVLSDSTETIISFQGSMSEFVDMIYDMDTAHTITTLYRINENTEKSVPKHSFLLKLCDTAAINYNEILCTTMKYAAFLKQDTLYEPAYCLTITDSAIFNNRKTNCEPQTTLKHLATHIQYIYDIPVVIDENIDSNQTICIKLDALNKVKSIDFLDKVLYKSSGLELIKSDIEVPVIEYKEYDLN